MNIKKDILWRVLVSIGFMAMLAVAIIWSIIKIQFVEGDKWKLLSDSLTLRLIEIPATRGSIFSDDGNLLATSIPQYSVSLDFITIKLHHKDSFKQHIPNLALAFSQILGNKSEAQFRSLLAKHYRTGSRYVTIKRKASFTEVNALKKLPVFHHNRFKSGMMLEERTIRKKPYNSLAFRTIGFINENKRGAGIELTYNTELEGDSGQMLVQKIAGGFRPVNEEAEIQPRNGSDVYTTIDIEAQDIVSSALLKGLNKHGARFGCAVVMDIKTGAIKAISNLTRTTSRSYTERYNYALGRLYEPGSTAKIVAAIALLEEKKVSLNDPVLINHGKFKYSDKTYTDDHYWEEVEVPFRSVIEKSSNAGTTFLIAKHFGKSPNQFFKYYDKLLVKPDLQTKLKGGKKPILVKPGSSDWVPTTLTSSAIGYSLKLTPIQILSLYNAIGNGGEMMRPHLISGIGSMQIVEEQFKPSTVREQIASEKTIAELQSMLRGVVLRGTAKNLKSLPFAVAGKTGTAKIADGNKGYIENAYNASFVGYFPADNPMYSCIVWVSWPRSGQYSGGTIAGPIFKEIASKLYARKVVLPVDSINRSEDNIAFRGYAPHFKTITKALDISNDFKKNKNWIEGYKDSLSTESKIYETGENKVPNFHNMGLRDALYYAESNGLELRFRGVGKVVEQSPEAGSLLSSKVIYIRLSTQ
jgi:cell division protein FtsI (penicillin-binding protein 3)